MVLRVDDLVAAAGGQVVSGPVGVVTGISIDSRTLRPGDLFVAIVGDRFDGHAFVGDAIRGGAKGIVVNDASGTSDVAEVNRRGGQAICTVRVDDTTRALQQFGRWIRRESGTQVVAITGSAGKTTTKELTAAALDGSYDVFRTQGNLNNHIGLPLSLIELRRRPEIAVLELGMNHAGEIRTLVGLSEPEHRVWTNVAEVHAEFFDSVDAIADAKAEILSDASATTRLVANADDRRVMTRLSSFPGRVTSFGIGAEADVRATNIRDLGVDGMVATVRTSGSAGEVGELRTSLLGEVAVLNNLAAVAVARGFDVPLQQTLSRLSHVRPHSRRGEVHRLGQVVVVDDTYNSNPTALENALASVGRASRGSGARFVACLGEMLELGERAEALHRACGRVAAAAGCDRLILVGGALARAMAQGAVDAGLSPDVVRRCDTSEDAAEVVAALLADGDVVLVKGSRGMHMDRVVDHLVEERG